jgi:hypothetical protein
MQKEDEKRREWERLLLGNRAPLSGDLPDELRRLLERLDERFGTNRGDAPAG